MLVSDFHVECNRYLGEQPVRRVKLAEYVPPDGFYFLLYPDPDEAYKAMVFVPKNTVLVVLEKEL